MFIHLSLILKRKSQKMGCKKALQILGGIHVKFIGREALTMIQIFCALSLLVQEKEKKC
jgi:hypothetical protein